jgi:hypothetical protein
VHGQSGVDDLVDDHDVAALDLGVEILQEADSIVALVVGSAVPGELEEVERMVDGQGAREVADERDARFHAPDEDRLSLREVAGELGTELAHAHADLAGVEEDFADALVERGGRAQDAFRSPYRAASRSKSRS